MINVVLIALPGSGLPSIMLALSQVRLVKDRCLGIQPMIELTSFE
jgi:hypothetical protein